MEIAVEGNESKLKVTVIGDIIAENVEEVRQEINDLLVRKPAEIELNLASVGFMDTSALGLLVGLRSHLKRQGTKFSISSPQPKVFKILQMTRLSKIFELEK